MITVSALVSDFTFLDGQVWLNVSYSADNAPAGFENGFAGFYIEIPTSTQDYNDKVAAGLTAWLVANAGFTPNKVIVGLRQPAMDSQGRGLVKLAGVESVNVYGRFTTDADAFDVASGTTVTRLFEWPFPLSIIEGAIYLSGTEAGDVASFSGPPTKLNDLIPGGVVLANAIGVGEKSLTFLPGLVGTFVNLALLDAGFWEVLVADAGGGNPESLVLVTGYDRTTGVVTLEIAKKWNSTNQKPIWNGFAFAHGQDAEVTITRWFVRPTELSSGTSALYFGRSARGGSPLPANVPMALSYANNDGAVRRVRMQIDLVTGVLE